MDEKKHKKHLTQNMDMKKKPTIYNFRLLTFILVVILGLTLASLRVIESNKVEDEPNEEKIQNSKNSSVTVIRQENTKDFNTIKGDATLEISTRRKSNFPRKKLTLKEERIKNREDSLIVRYYKRVYMKLNY